MSTDVINIIWSVIVPSLITVAGTWILGSRQRKNIDQQNKKIQVDIEAQYKGMLEDQIDRNNRLMEENEKIKTDYRELRHAFTRAIAFIRENVRGVEIPDFFEDTGRLKRLGAKK